MVCTFYHFFKLLLIFTLVSNLLSQEPSSRLDSNERERVISKICTLLVNNYVFSELGSESAAYLEDQFNNGAYDDITHPKGFVKKINTDLKKIQSDKHVRVQFISPEQEKLQKQDPFLARLLDISEKAIDNYGLHEVKIFENNVGYINIRSFEPVDLASSKVNSVMHFLEDTDALIIDLRYNHGGNPAMVQYICSHFIEHPTHLNSFYWRRGDYIEQFWTLSNLQARNRPEVPLFILTSSNTFSAGEVEAGDDFLAFVCIFCECASCPEFLVIRMRA